MSRYKHRQAQKEEDRAKAFERVFNDPDVDLEEVAAQVRPPRASRSPFCLQGKALLQAGARHLAERTIHCILTQHTFLVVTTELERHTYGLLCTHPL